MTKMTLLPGIAIIHSLCVLSALCFHFPTEKKDNYTIDILVLADYQLYQKWYKWSNASEPLKSFDTLQNMEKYFSLLFQDLNAMYNRIRTAPFTLSVSVSDIIIATSHQSPISKLGKKHRRGDRILADEVLLALKSYTLIQRQRFRPHDHVMLFSGYDLISHEGDSPSVSTKGVAFIKSMCDRYGYSSSLVEDSGGFSSLLTVAHELAHSLGAAHDGDNACSASAQYVMTAVRRLDNDVVKKNSYIFSSCSVTEISEIVKLHLSNKSARRTGPKCYEDTVDPTWRVPDVIGMKSGQMLEPDAVCRHIFGDKSYHCRKITATVQEKDICLSMFCRDPDDNSFCYSILAPEGTSCGNKKWCSLGSCVFSPLAPSKVEGCVHGDRVEYYYQGLTCKELGELHPEFCENRIIAYYCCKTCYRNFEYYVCKDAGDPLFGQICLLRRGAANVNVLSKCGLLFEMFFWILVHKLF